MYKEESAILEKAIESFLNSKVTGKLFLIDNSPDDRLKKKAYHPDVEYIHNESNLGFARSHNLVIDRIKNLSEYHLILNPDTFFDNDVIPKLILELNDNTATAMIAPKVIYPNGELQYTARTYPCFLELVIRRISLFKGYIGRREYRNNNLSEVLYPDFLHGCFMLFKTTDFTKIGGFDERYFLYMEDVDICRKIDGIGKKKLYYPKVQITHVLKKGSSKSLRLFFIHLSSSIKYFKKWGFR